MQPAKKQAGLLVNDSSLMMWTLALENGQLDPGKVRIKACAPNDIPNIHNAAVFQYGQTVVDTMHAGKARYAGSGQVAGQHTDERSAFIHRPGSYDPADRIVNGKQAVKQYLEYEAAQENARCPPGDTEGNMPGVPARE